MKYLLLFTFFIVIVESKLIKNRTIIHEKEEKLLLQNGKKIQEWVDKHDVTNETCFIHIPRTGGLGLRRALKAVNIHLVAWHSLEDQPPLSCGCYTNIRHPADRYVSEWKFYGLNWFAQNHPIFGWYPANGIPHTFDEFLVDHSTHNAMTKILSGCQMYSNCDVDNHSIDKIMERVERGCLNILFTEDMPVHYHKAIYDDKNITWREEAIKVNDVDMELFRRLTKK